VILRLLLRILRPIVEPARLQRMSQFASLPKAQTDVLFVGDSITDLGLWYEWFPKISTINRGISGNTSAQVIERLDTLAAGAKAVFLLIGTNDLTLGVAEDQIVANVEKIVAFLVSDFPGATIVIQSVMPRSAKWKKRLESLNVRYQKVASEHGVDYLDLWPVLADASGTLPKAISLDALHLNGPGYQKWVDEISPIVSRALA
jgi:lysophospholipase L1-like esterase